MKNRSVNVGRGVCAAIVAVMASCACGDVVNGVWTGAENAFWTNANNWAGGVVPGRYRADDGAGNTVTNGEGGCSATFGASASASFPTIDLDGLVTISTVTVENASMQITFGTGISQKFPIEAYGLLKVATGAVAPAIVASMPYTAWVPYGYWDKDEHGNYRKPGITVQNNSTGTLVLDTLCAQEGSPQYQSATELQFILIGTGDIRIGGSAAGWGGLHIFQNLTNPAKLTIASHILVREIVTESGSYGDALVEIAEGGELKSGSPWYGFLNFSRAVRIFGDGTLCSAVGRLNSTSQVFVDVPNVAYKALIIETPVVSEGNYAAPDYIPGLNFTAGNGGMIEFKNTVNAPGGIWMGGSSTLCTPTIGADGETASFGTGGITLYDKGGLRYTGPGETTTRSIAITNTSQKLEVKGASATFTQAGNGVWNVATSPAIHAGTSLSATLTLSNVSASQYDAIFSGTLADGDGTLSVEKSGNGTWRLTAVNTYSGSTTVNAGTLEIAPGASIASSSSVAMKGGTLKFADGDDAVSYSLPALSAASGASTVYVGANANISFAGVSRTGSSTINFQVPNLPAKIAIAGLSDGAAPAYITVNGKATTYSAEGGLAIPSTPGAHWKAAVDGDWFDGTKWDGGAAPASDEAATLNAYGRSYTASVTSPVTMDPVASLSVGNARVGSVATIAVSNTVVSTATNGIAVGKGGRILVGEGGLFKYDNSPVTAVGYTKTFMTVSDGGEFVIDGGKVALTNFNGYLDVKGTAGATGTVRFVSGDLSIVDHDHVYGTYTGGAALRIQAGGRFEQTGATNHIASYYNGSSPFQIGDGGEVDVSGNSSWHMSNGYWDNGKDAIIYHTFSGNTCFRDNAILDAYPGALTRLFVAPQANGKTAVLEFQDHAKFDSERGDSSANAPYIVVGGKTIKGYSYLRFRSDAWHHESSKSSPSTQHWRNTGHCISVGDLFGYGELEVADGVVSAGIYGFRAGTRWNHVSYSSSTPACVTGVVRVTGGVLRTSSNINVSPGWWEPGSGFQGDQIGTSAGYSADTGLYYGRMEVDAGAYTNTRAALTIGYGCGIGEWFQRGGISVICSEKTGFTNGKPKGKSTDFYHYYTNHVFSIGLAGGTGRFTQTGGEVIDNLRTYVGGTPFAELTPYSEMHEQYGNGSDDYSASINDYISRGYGDRHGATGYLGVLGGTFTADHAIYVGKDGTGVLEIGPTGTLSAAAIVLANNEYVSPGTPAATLKFTFGVDGVGTATVTNLVIGAGAALTVDMTGYAYARSKPSRFPLVRAANVEGAFDEANVTLLIEDTKLASKTILERQPDGIDIKIMNGSAIIFR